MCDSLMFIRNLKLNKCKWDYGSELRKETKENTTGSLVVRYFLIGICDVIPPGQSCTKNTF